MGVQKCRASDAPASFSKKSVVLSTRFFGGPFRARRPSLYEKHLHFTAVPRPGFANSPRLPYQKSPPRSVFESPEPRDPMQHPKICTALWRELNSDPKILKNNRFSRFLYLHCACTVIPAKLQPNSSQSWACRKIDVFFYQK